MKTRILFLIASALVQFTTLAQSGKRAHYNLENNVAVQGYDPVAYFRQGKAVKGKKEFSSSYQGVVYYFANAADKEIFSKNPSAYEPQYGGWCAYAMGTKGEKVDIDPETFRITDGKLYLFYNAYFNNTRTSWDKDPEQLKRKADANWKQTIN